MIRPGYKERQDAQVLKQAREQIEYCERMQMARGRPPKAVTIAKKLEDALAFIAVAGTKKIRPTDDHCMLVDKMALMTDGQLYAGYPIDEDINCVPHLANLRSSLKKCGTSLNITVLDSNRLSIKGDKFRSFIKCLTWEEMPDVEPDNNVYSFDGTELVNAFAVCNTLADENNERVVLASVLLDGNNCCSTDAKSMLQYWHGCNLPPKLVLPKIFTQAVCKVKEKIVGFGYTPERSITLWFENGAWLKTILYLDIWPDTDGILNHAANNVISLPTGIVEGCEAIKDFGEEEDVYFGAGQLMSHNNAQQGAQYEVEGLIAGKHVKADQILKLAAVCGQMDYMTHERHILFFGERARGVCHCYGPESEG